MLQGINLVQELIDAYGLGVVQAYMGHIQQNAELAVRQMLRAIRQVTPDQRLYAIDYLDDGSPIRLVVSLDEENGSAVCDFRSVIVDKNDWMGQVQVCFVGCSFLIIQPFFNHVTIVNAFSDP